MNWYRVGIFLTLISLTIALSFTVSHFYPDMNALVVLAGALALVSAGALSFHLMAKYGHKKLIKGGSLVAGGVERYRKYHDTDDSDEESSDDDEEFEDHFQFLVEEKKSKKEKRRRR